MPAGSIPNASSAAASLCPPRLTYGFGLRRPRSATAASMRSPGLRSSRARRPPRPGPCRPARAPAHGCATRPGRDRRAAGRGGRARACRSSRGSPAYRGTAALHRGLTATPAASSSARPLPTRSADGLLVIGARTTVLRLIRSWRHRAAAWASLGRWRAIVDGPTHAGAIDERHVHQPRDLLDHHDRSRVRQDRP